MSSSRVALIKSLFSCSAAAAAASDCFPIIRRWCTNRVTIESMRLVNDAVISLLRTSANPSRSAPDTGPTEPELLRNASSLSANSDDNGGFGV